MKQELEDGVGILLDRIDFISDCVGSWDKAIQLFALGQLQELNLNLSKIDWCLQELVKK